MTPRRHFDRLAQPRQGEPLVLSPATSYFPVLPEPFAPISLEQAETGLGEPSAQARSVAQASSVGQATPVAPMLSPAPQHLARKAAPPAAATPPIAALPTRLPAQSPVNPTPADPLPAPPFADPSAQSGPAIVSQPGASVPLPSAAAPGLPRSARAADTPEPAVIVATPDHPATGFAIGDSAAPPDDAEPLHPAVTPHAAALPRRAAVASAPHSAAREATPDFGVPGLAAWLEPAKAAAPAPAMAAPPAGGIHIGAVEVHVLPPQPAPQVPQRAPVAAQVTLPALARGYGWRFGLGQS